MNAAKTMKVTSGCAHQKSRLAVSPKPRRVIETKLLAIKNLSVAGTPYSENARSAFAGKYKDLIAIKTANVLRER